MNHAACTVFAFAVVAFGGTVIATAHPTGVTGRTATSSQGCGGGECHGASNSATALTILEAVDGKLLVQTGAVISLTLRVANAQKISGGCDIAVRTSLNGLIRAGTLAAVPGDGLVLSGNELTHFQPKALADGSVDFVFTWQAPSNATTCYLQAVGNAVNLNGSASGDNWSFLEPVQVIVSKTDGVNESVSPLTSMFPVPAHNSVTVTAETVSGTSVEVQVIDAIGQVVSKWTGTSNSDQFVYVWDGRTQGGSPVLPGTYTVAVLNERRTYIGRAMIVR